MASVYFRGNTNEIWRIAKDDSDGASIEANSGETLVKKDLSQSDFDLIVGETKTFDESTTVNNIVLRDNARGTVTMEQMKEDFETELNSFDKFLDGNKPSDMRDRLTAYRARLSSAFSHAMVSGNETFTVHPAQYTSNLNPGEEVFNRLQVPD